MWIEAYIRTHTDMYDTVYMRSYIDIDHIGGVEHLIDALSNIIRRYIVCLGGFEEDGFMHDFILKWSRLALSPLQRIIRCARARGIVPSLTERVIPAHIRSLEDNAAMIPFHNNTHHEIPKALLLQKARRAEIKVPVEDEMSSCISFVLGLDDCLFKEVLDGLSPAKALETPTT